MKNRRLRIVLVFLLIGWVIGLAVSNPVPARLLQKVDDAKAVPATSGSIENPTAYFFLAAEGSSFFSALGQLQRFVSSTLLENQNIPSNFSFQNFFDLPLLLNFKSPVPIFIKGHVLRH